MLFLNLTPDHAATLFGFCLRLFGCNLFTNKKPQVIYFHIPRVLGLMSTVVVPSYISHMHSLKYAFEFMNLV